MKIIILGAGRVGYSVAESLVSERNDITVIDTDADRLRELESRFDLRGVVGNGIDPAVLAEAGAKDTDLLLEAKYALSKRTFAYAAYYKDGDKKLVTGAKNHLGLGVRHNF